jgi:hypothetical protein
MELPTDVTSVEKQTIDTLIYTPWEEAVRELEVRKNDAVLERRLKTLLPHGIPAPMENNMPYVVLFRNIATSNYETNRFVIIADSLSHYGLKPLLLEYLGDNFNDRNHWKHLAGRLCFSKGINKRGEWMFETLNLINFNDSNNKPLASLRTLWGESFVELHHTLFERRFPSMKGCYHDISSWLQANGGRAREYYRPFLSLFLRDGILLDNFLMSSKESSFTRDVVLPIFKEVQEETGYKPLIVPLDPPSMEGHDFWYYHPLSDKGVIEELKGKAV